MIMIKIPKYFYHKAAPSTLTTLTTLKLNWTAMTLKPLPKILAKIQENRINIRSNPKETSCLTISFPTSSPRIMGSCLRKM